MLKFQMCLLDVVLFCQMKVKLDWGGVFDIAVAVQKSQFAV